MKQQELVNIDTEYIPWSKAIGILCDIDSKDKFISPSFREGLQKFDKHFNIVKLKKKFYYKKYNEFATYVVLKKDVLKFKENYINRLEAFPMQSYYSRVDSLETHLKRKNVEIVRIAQKDKLVFYNKNQFIKFLEEKRDSEEERAFAYAKTLSIDSLIYQEQLCKKYDITLDKWKRVDKVVNLEKTTINKRIYYKEKDVDDLLSSIRLGIDELYEKYYSATYLKSEYNFNRAHLRNNKNIKDIKVPPHYKPLLPYADNSYFYDKESVDEYLKQRAFYSVATKEPYDAYKYKITRLLIN